MDTINTQIVSTFPMLESDFFMLVGCFSITVLRQQIFVTCKLMFQEKYCCLKNDQKILLQGQFSNLLFVLVSMSMSMTKYSNFSTHMVLCDWF